MKWFRMPLFVWSLYATAWTQILATPILAIAVLLLVLERMFGIGFFDPTKGGDPILFEHLFWIYSHPAVYIMILPEIFRAALPQVWMRERAERRNPSLSASRMATSETSGRSCPSRRRLMPTITS
jgi:cytochrome c oxidase subunit 1